MMEIEQLPRDETHPNPQPSNHRKIELQSPHDLTYLQNNLAKVALEKLNFVLPDNPSSTQTKSISIPTPATVISLDGPNSASDPSPQNQPQPELSPDSEPEPQLDPLKEEVRSLISHFLKATWSTAQENLTLNGLDATNLSIPPGAILSKSPPTQQVTPLDPAEEIEGIHFTYSPFDPRLQHKLSQLHGDLERLTSEVSKLRRSAPRDASGRYKEILDDVMAQDEQGYEKLRVKDEGMVETGLELQSVREGWSDDVRNKYTRGVGELKGLAGVQGKSENGHGVDSGSGNGTSLMETMGKVSRARDVVLEME